MTTAYADKDYFHTYTYVVRVRHSAVKLFKRGT